MLRPVLLLVLLLLAGCARPSAPVWTELPSAETLLQRIAETTGRIDSLDAAAGVGLTINGKYRSSQQFLLVKKPDRLRADVLTGFGQLVLQLASDGEELSVFLNTTVPGRFLRGPATDENLARFTQVPLSIKNMVRLLLYDPPLIAYQQHEVKVSDGQLLLRLVADTQEQELVFDAQLRLVGCRYFLQTERFLEVRFLQLDAADQFPLRVQIELPAEQTTLTLTFSELLTNVSIADERFRLSQPANILLEPLP
jgi:outer membrane lipoprotein-sorting protein